MIRSKLPPYQRNRSCIGGVNNKFQVMSVIQDMSDIPELPQGTVVLENQVAGHTFQNGTNAIGMLKSIDDGSILKPCTKPMCGQREINFYEMVQNTKDTSLLPLKELIPEYRGTQKFFVGGREIEFIKMTDLTHGMLEPCIMDIKIGRRTWDPLASAEKKATEENKYMACKDSVGLCIPGFQVSSITSGKVKRFSKEYGKKLNEKTIKDALRLFLNADAGLCRSLLMHILSGLWSIQKWARAQKKVRLYASSLLIVYDARYIRQNLEIQRKKSQNLSNGLLSNSSPSSPNTPPTAECNNESDFNWKADVPPSEQVKYKKIQRSHSASNNYDEDIKAMRENYVFMLDNLVGAYDDKKQWAFVKMIDFAHVFDAPDDNELDTNYLEGVENLVKMFEEFLKESE